MKTKEEILEQCLIADKTSDGELVQFIPQQVVFQALDRYGEQCFNAARQQFITPDGRIEMFASYQTIFNTLLALKQEFEHYREEFERQSKKHWTKKEWMAAMDLGELCCFPTTENQVKWFEEWFDNNPEEKERAERESIEYKARRFDEISCNLLLFRIFLRDNVAKYDQNFTFKYDVDANEVTVYAYKDKFTLKLY